jgi:glutamate--cysteine ligase
MAADVAAVRAAVAEVGVELVGAGIDPVRPPQRIVHSPRYDAMERYFDDDGPEGRTMMASTASLQVNLDLGPASDLEDRWRLAHAVSPVLAAAFANSPIVAGRATGMRSSRLATWSRLDRSRTAPGLGCDWADYALDALVLLVRDADGTYVPEATRQSFRQWILHGHALGWPDEDDLAYHLTTLFPPVRPRGWMEVRVVDSLPDPWWRVAVAVTAALLDDPAAASEARAATVDVAGLWVEAAHHGLAHPALAVAARRCFAAALDALGRLDVDAVTTDACREYFERYIARERCPADDVLAEVR